MSVLTWFRDLRKALRDVGELKEIERKKIAELQDCENLEAATMCLNEITINVKRGETDKAKKKEGAV